MCKIIILDYREGVVIVRNFNSEAYKEEEDFLISQNLNPADCSWMTVEQLKIDVR